MTQAAEGETARETHNEMGGDAGGETGGGRRDPAGRFWRVPIASAITLTFGGLLTLAVLAVGFVTWRANELNTLDLLGDSAELYLDSLSGLTRAHLQDGRFQVNHIARLVRDGDLDLDDVAEVEAVLTGSLAAGDQIQGIALVTPDGQARRVGYLGGRLVRLVSDWSQRPEIRRLLTQARAGDLGDGYVVVWSDDLAAPHVSASAALVDPDGSFRGAVSVVVAITAISDFVDSLATGGTRSFVLLGRERVLAHANMPAALPALSQDKPLPTPDDLGDVVLARMWEAPLLDETLREILVARNAQAHAAEVGGQRYLFVYRDLGTMAGEPVTVGIYAPLDNLNQPLRRLIGSGAVAVLILLVAIGLAVLLGRKLARPVRRLEAAADAVARLNLEAMPPLERSRLRELDAAQRTFASMRTALGWFEIYVPRPLVARLMRVGPGATRSESREVTVLFTDIAGFTQLAEQHSPEELAALLNDHFGRLAACVEAEGGIVDKYIGDSLMAFWGAPETQPDHAARGLRAARAMAAAVSADNAARRARGDAPVHLRIGLHSGPAVVGNIGAPSRMNYTLIGDTVNVAQRLEGLGKDLGMAEPGQADGSEVTILASAEVLAAAGTREGCVHLGEIALRGRDGHVEVYRL